MNNTWQNDKKTNFGGGGMVMSVTRYHGQLSYVKYQKKLVIQSWENLVTNSWIDRQEWFQRMLYNAEGCPTSCKYTYTYKSSKI